MTPRSKYVLCCAALWLCVAVCCASPARRQFSSSSATEATSSEPVTNEEAAWDDEFDLDGDDWLREASPSSSLQRADYEDYEDDVPSSKQPEKAQLSSKDDAEEDVLDAEEDDTPQDGNKAEFLFVPSKDTRLVLQDDDDQSGLIKVRHTGKNSYLDTDSSEENEKDGDNQQVDFMIDDDDDQDDGHDKEDDFVLEDAPQKRENTIEELPQPQALKHNDDDEDADDKDDDDDNLVSDEDNGDDLIFESPEEDSQVIYGDHVFLY